MNFEFFIAKRYFKGKRKIGFISIVTYFATIGIAIGVMVLNIVLSVMNGFEDIVKEKIIGAISHIQVVSFHNEGIVDYDSLCTEIKKIKGVTGVSPLIFSKSAIQSKENLDVIILNGIDTNRVDQVIDLRKYIIGGVLDLGLQYDEESGDSLPGIVLGYDLADRLRLVVGQTVVLGSFRTVSLMGNMMPKLKKCVVTGIFKSGFYDYDAAFGFVSLKTAQNLFFYGNKVNQIDVRIKDMYQAKKIASIIEKKLKYPYYTLNWIDRNKKLFTWIKLEKYVMFTILNLIIFVAVFNIISALIMLVLNKTKEIGILRAMGATKKNIMKIFMYDGLSAGIIGVITGTLLSILVCYLQQKYKIISIPSDLYTIDALPVKMIVNDFVLVGLSGLILSFLATLYPAKKASEQKPVEALVYE